MSDMNSISLTGRIGSDIEQKYTPAGLGITSFSFACSRPKGKDEAEGETDWFRVTFFGVRGDAIAKFAAKGHKLGLTGRIQLRTYTDKENNERTSVGIIGSDFTFLQPKGETPEPTREKVATDAHDNESEGDPFADE